MTDTPTAQPNERDRAFQNAIFGATGQWPSDAFILEYRAEIEAAARADERARSGWQTIDTAPRDGSEIIICYAKQGRITSVSKACWVTAEFWADLEGGDPEDFVAGWFEPDAEDELCATHWQPLGAIESGEI